MNDIDGFLSAIIVALARTWDAKLPGFLGEFRAQVDALYIQTPPGELRTALDRLSEALTKPEILSA